MNTVQCHPPLTVGASGSCIVIVKLLVPGGGAVKVRAGEQLPQWHPKPFKIWPGGIVAPSANIGLVTIKSPLASARRAGSIRIASRIKKRGCMAGLFLFTHLRQRRQSWKLSQS